MVELYRNSAPIDVATVYNSLGSAAANIGGLAYLSQICGACCTALKINAHEDIVKEMSQLRAPLISIL